MNLRAAILFGAIAMVGSFTGARLATFLAGETQLALLAIVMLVAAVAMFRRRDDASEGHAPREVPIAMGLLAVVGFGVGLLTGLVGIGGGFLAVPALVVIAGLPMKRAVGTSLVVIAMNTASGLLGYLGRVPIAWGFVAMFTTMAIVGILAGTYLVRFVPQRALRRAFAVFLVIIGAYMLYHNVGAH